MKRKPANPNNEVERQAKWKQRGGELIARADIDEVYPSELGDQPPEPRTAYAVRIAELIRNGQLSGPVDETVMIELGELAAASDERR